MPVDLEIIRASEFLRMGGHGEFDLIASCALLAKLARACRLRGIHRALIDIRQSRAPLTPSELAALVNAFHDIGFTRDLRLAILHSGDRYRRARTFAFLSRMRGWMVQTFGDFEGALYWLSAPETPARKPATGRRLPVTDVSEEASFVRHFPEQHRSLRINRQH